MGIEMYSLPEKKETLKYMINKLILNQKHHCV